MLLDASITSIELLSDQEIDEMFELHGRFYDNVNKKVFYRDVREKHWVIRMYDGGGYMVGFSTCGYLSLNVASRSCIFLFSGDTIVDPKFWGASVLAGSFTKILMRMLQDFPEHELFWFLICKGYRTYRFLPIYFREFYPVYDQPTPLEYRRFLNTVSLAKFGNHYNPQTGIISFSGKKDRLREEMCEIDSERLHDPHIRYFFETNTNFRDGDELACITRVARHNFKPVLFRAFNRTKVAWRE